MRNTTIIELCTYPCQLKVGNTQSLTFTYGDAGPFYFSDEEREGLKFDVFWEKKGNNKRKFISNTRAPLQRRIGEDCQFKTKVTYFQSFLKERGLDGQAKGLAPDLLELWNYTVKI